MDMNRNDDDRQWHVDKKVPIALIVTICVAFGSQTIAGVWWASSTSTRLEQTERELALLKPQTGTTAEKVIRIETKIEAIGESITEIKNLIRQRTP
jgi:hypothetical protein